MINKMLIENNKINKDATNRTIKLPLGLVHQSFIFARKENQQKAASKRISIGS